MAQDIRELKSLINVSQIEASARSFAVHIPEEQLSCKGERDVGHDSKELIFADIDCLRFAVTSSLSQAPVSE